MIRHAPYAEGRPDFAIGLRPIADAGWLEGGEVPEAIAARKDALLASHPAEVWAETPGSRAGQAEVLDIVAATLGVQPKGAKAPLLTAARLVPDDLCLMEKVDGAWRAAALSLCSGSFFTAAQAVGRTLEELHGPVPAFDQRFLPRVERIFDALQPGVILERRNWTVVNSGELFVPDVDPARAAAEALSPEDAPEALHVRVERQTIRKLPLTGGALFTIRVWVNPLRALADDPERLAAFAAAWRGATADFRAYKQLARYDRLVEAFLETALA